MSEFTDKLSAVLKSFTATNVNESEYLYYKEEKDNKIVYHMIFELADIFGPFRKYNKLNMFTPSSDSYFQMIDDLALSINSHNIDNSLSKNVLFDFSQYECEGTFSDEFAQKVLNANPSAQELLDFYNLTSSQHPYALFCFLNVMLSDPQKYKKYTALLFKSGQSYLSHEGEVSNIKATEIFTDLIYILNQYSFSSLEMMELISSHKDNSICFEKIDVSHLIYTVGQVFSGDDQEKMLIKLTKTGFIFENLFETIQNPNVIFKMDGKRIKANFGFKSDGYLNNVIDSIEKSLIDNNLLEKLGLKELALDYSFKKQEVRVFLVSHNQDNVNQELMQTVLTQSLKMGENFEKVIHQNPQYMEDIVLYATLNHNLSHKSEPIKKLKI